MTVSDREEVEDTVIVGVWDWVDVEDTVELKVAAAFRVNAEVRVVEEVCEKEFVPLRVGVWEDEED